ncbi:AAA family ATPase [Caldilinea sp.]|jgi:predicted ATPase|uniref:AAA family ATPase n=1 Tax=Caldilinea sp. TaxID=2293560 RepID=UPI0021DD6415|nr:ATP-binding protein [Caldilinea sp.]GIV68435.1 MAG: chromosome segregation protein SMC [Caldilinea sp.]
MYVCHVKLRNWKNFKEAEADLRLRTFVIGPNASGKSNLLDAFRFLRDVATDGLRKAVDDERGGVSMIRCLAATRYSNIDIEMQLAERDQPIWTYRLSFNQDNNRRPVVREEVVKRHEKVITQRPNEADERDPELLTQTALEQISANQDFREVAVFFKSISYQHLLPQVVRDPRSFSPLPIQDDPFGRDFLLRLWRTPSKTRDSRLRKIAEALRHAVPQLTDLSVEMDDTGAPHLIGKYSHWRIHAAKQNESQFSDGTLRLLGLLWTIFEGDGPLLLEEPEISLHPEVVRQLPAIFHRINRNRKTPRQIIISTHSEEILRDPGIAPEEVLRLEPSAQGTLLRHADEADRQAMSAGLTAADVLMPKTAPANAHQMVLEFP